METLPRDLLLKIFSILDLPTLATCLCVSTEWLRTGKDSSLWTSIRVPRHLAPRVWDYELGVMLWRCAGGRLRNLDVSGSGITGKSLINIFQMKALAPEMEELAMEHCCNLKACDILAFLQAIKPSAASSSSSSSPSASASSSSRSEVQTFPSGFAHFRLPLPRPLTSTVRSLRMDGCKCATIAEVQAISSLVRHLDVAACGCNRVACLKTCDQPQCPGLCARCVEVYAGCELKCGACSRPRDPRQAMQANMRRRIAQTLGGGEAARTRWTVVRSGVVTVRM
eukprot:TRINITY_DN18185_c0_g1_i1.p1 TRINITY_DN18185_c0_g1~~TRINITY_DN18185_c0_g1_i1.p1  ORF type:complete len:282 (+),score=-34.61 TRINITY_DN18185_c0_g1_i1:185-1030(+)